MALEVQRGMKIGIKCDCYEYNVLFHINLRTLKKCFVKKSAYIIQKGLD